MSQILRQAIISTCAIKMNYPNTRNRNLLLQTSSSLAVTPFHSSILCSVQILSLPNGPVLPNLTSNGRSWAHLREARRIPTHQTAPKASEIQPPEQPRATNDNDCTTVSNHDNAGNSQASTLHTLLFCDLIAIASTLNLTTYAPSTQVRNGSRNFVKSRVLDVENRKSVTKFAKQLCIPAFLLVQ